MCASSLPKDLSKLVFKYVGGRMKFDISRLNLDDLTIFFSGMMSCAVDYVPIKSVDISDGRTIVYRDVQDRKDEGEVFEDEEEVDESELPKVKVVKYNFGKLNISGFKRYFEFVKGNIGGPKEYDVSNADVINNIVAVIVMSSCTIKNPYNILIKNDMGFNYDWRGSNGLDVALPFKGKTKLTGDFNFYDFASAILLLKSHKFDNNYELFYAMKVTTKGKKKLLLEIIGDHGS